MTDAAGFQSSGPDRVELRVNGHKSKAEDMMNFEGEMNSVVGPRFRTINHNQLGGYRGTSWMDAKTAGWAYAPPDEM